MNIEDDPQCIFSTEISHGDLGHAIEVPPEEIELGSLDPNSPVRVAIYQPHSESQSGPQTRNSNNSTTESNDTSLQPPVSTGESRSVTIDDRGNQGDGIAKVGTGFVLIVPGADVGETVDVKITNVKDNFAIAEPIQQDTVPEAQLPPYRQSDPSDGQS